MNIPENNSLKTEIEEIVRLCEEAKEEYGEKSSYFEAGISEREMTEWEEANGVKIPESYKEWLRFSANCQILYDLASLTMPSHFNSDYVPQDLIIIGNIIGDGELLCFSKTTGKIIRYNHGKTREYDDFKNFLNCMIIRMLKNSIE